jgi:hypothetical protein
MGRGVGLLAAKGKCNIIASNNFDAAHSSQYPLKVFYLFLFMIRKRAGAFSAGKKCP